MPSKQQRLVLATLGAIGAVVVLLLASRWGAGITTDSVRYIATARNMTSGAGLITHLDGPLVLHAPLYPVLLSAVERVTGIDPFAAAPIVNAVLLGVLVYLSGVLLFRYLPGDTGAVYLATGLMVVAMPILKTSVMAWSEPLFSVFVVAFLVSLSRHLERGNVSSLVLASVFAALACLTRYIGVTLIVAGVVAVLVVRRAELRGRWRRALTLALVAGSPLAAWAVRNHLLTGTLFGERPSSPYPLYRNLITAINTVLAWHIHWKVVWYGWVPFLAFAVVWLVVTVSRKRTRPRLVDYLRSIGPVGLFVVFYWGSLALASTLTAADEIGDRLMSPLFVPVLVLILVLAGRGADRMSRRLPLMTARRMLLAAIVLLMIYPATLSAQFVREYLERGGYGYNSDLWRGSPTVHYLLTSGLSQSGEVLYSNGPAVAYFLANAHARTIPAVGAYNSPDVVGDFMLLEGKWPAERRAVLVWFDGVRREHLTTVAQLSHVARVAPLERFDDGAVYLVGRK